MARVLGLIASLALVLAIAACGGGGESSASESAQQPTTFPDPADLVVRLDDIPAGFVLVEEGLGPGPMDALRDDNSVAGYRVIFGSPNQGLTCLVSVDEFEEVAKTRYALASGSVVERLDSSEEVSGEVASIDEDIGDEAYAYVIEGQDGDAMFFSVVWRFANTVSSCAGGGPDGADPELAIEAAKKQQERIEAALG